MNVGNPSFDELAQAMKHLAETGPFSDRYTVWTNNTFSEVSGSNFWKGNTAPKVSFQIKRIVDDFFKTKGEEKITPEETEKLNNIKEGLALLLSKIRTQTHEERSPWSRAVADFIFKQTGWEKKETAVKRSLSDSIVEILVHIDPDALRRIEEEVLLNEEELPDFDISGQDHNGLPAVFAGVPAKQEREIEEARVADRKAEEEREAAQKTFLSADERLLEASTNRNTAAMAVQAAEAKISAIQQRIEDNEEVMVLLREIHHLKSELSKRQKHMPDSPDAEPDAGIVEEINVFQSEINTKNAVVQALPLMKELASMKQEYLDVVERFEETGREFRDAVESYTAAEQSTHRHLNVDAYIEKIMNKYEVGADGNLLQDGKDTGLSKHTVEGVIREAYAIFTADPEIKVFSHGVDGKAFIVLREGAEVHITALTEKLGSGGFGGVYLAFDVASRNLEIYKEAHTSVNDAMTARAHVDVENEYGLSLYLWEGVKKGVEKRLLGLAAPGRKMIRISPAGEAGSVGMLAPLYREGNYRNKIFARQKTVNGLDFSPEKKSALEERILMEDYQLLSGLRTLSRKKIIHSDIKPENILCDEDPILGLPIAVIGDFGGARRENVSDAITPEYAAKADYQRRIELVNKINGQGLTEVQKKHSINELLELAEKMDVYSMGCVLFESFEFNMPYSRYAVRHPVPDARRPFQNTPAELQPLIDSMLDPDPSKRPAAADAFEKYDAFLRNHKQELYERMQTKIAAYQAS